MLLKNSQYGGKRYEYRAKINAFCDSTNEKYKNCNERHVNTVDINIIDDNKLDKIRKAENIEKLPIKNIINNNEIAELVGFYNIHKRYDSKEKCSNNTNCGLDIGTVVNKDRLGDIFKNSELSSKTILQR